MLWVSCIDIISRSRDDFSFRLLAYGPCLRIGNPLICIHSLLENMTFVSMNNSASIFCIMLNLSCFAALAVPLPEEHSSSMTTSSPRAAADSPAVAEYSLSRV